MPFCLSFKEDADTGASLVCDDDGRTCYAYLRDEDGRIVGDCWLYNHGPAPEVDPWHDHTNAPFANPRRFVNTALADAHMPIQSEDDIRVAWRSDGSDIYLRGQLFACLRVGAKPGWCRLAAKDGPLAKRLLT